MEDDATALAARVASGDVHPVELVEEAIARIEAVDPTLNAVIHRQFERARREAAGTLPDGPFRGVPFLLKDYGGEQAGEPDHRGMVALRDAGWRAPLDSEFATRVRAAGLVPLGRTNTPELALMGTTEPDAYGPTHNPWDLTRSPGGSSGGSAAAVAAGMVPAAHANDVAGSIRIPAAQCGLVGFKPSRGRTGSPGGVGLFAQGFVVGSVRDAAGLLDAVSPTGDRLLPEVGRDPGRLRVGVSTSAVNGAAVDAECAAAAIEAARTLEDLGHVVEAAAPAALFEPDLWAGLRFLLAVNAAAELEACAQLLGRPLGEGDVEAATWSVVTTGQAARGCEVVAALGRQDEIVRRVLAWWSAFDLLVTPTTADPAPPLGEYKRGFAPGRASAFTRVFNATGQPALSLPLGWPADGLPRGVQLVAGAGRDDVLVRVGCQLEAAAPWAERQPPVHADTAAATG